MTTFLIIGVVGLVLLIISLVLGDLVGGVFDALSGDTSISATIGGFAAALGFGGALAEGLGASTRVSVAVGIVVGLAFGGLAAWLTRLIGAGATDDTPSSGDLIGRDALVLTDIPAEGFGTVRVRVGGHTLQLNAKAEHAIAVGTPVHVTGALSPTAVTVAPDWDELDPGPG